MIIPVIGAPGTGKTTVCQELTQRYGVPHFELSWMPEFRRRNGVAIPSVADERAAVRALIAIAKVYTDEGHQVVCVSDFRTAVLPMVFAALGADPYTVVRLYISDEPVLTRRGGHPTRPSGYRDAAAALAANREIMALHLGGSLDIDVAHAGIDAVIATIHAAILVPNRAV